MEMIVTRLVVVVNDDNHDNARTLLARNATHALVNGACRQWHRPGAGGPGPMPAHWHVCRCHL